MKVTVRSLLAEPLQGDAEIETDSSSTADSVIETFCVRKGITARFGKLTLYTPDNKPLSPGSTLESQGIDDGAILFLGQTREADDIEPMMKWPIVAGAILFVSLGGLIAVCLLYELTGGKIPFDYGIVIDAGSTHSQITVYKWEGQKDEGTGKVTQVATCRVNGGIQTTKNISTVGELLLPCLHNVSKSIPMDRHGSIPLYLGATAGMRLLKLKDPEIAEAIILLIQCALSHSGFDVKSVGIIDGKDEGMFAWITANFLLDKLYVEEHEPYSTSGALDLGGASTQISFEVAPEHKAGNGTHEILKLYGHSHVVFSESYLCFGTVEAMRRHHAMLAVSPAENQTISDPCGLVGDVVNYTYNDLFNQPCTKKKTYGFTEDATFTFHGTGNNSECKEAVSRLLSYTECKKNYTECFESPKQQISNVTYMAVSGYYYVTKYLNLTNSTLEEYQEKMNSYCHKNYSEALEMFDADESDYARYYCFEAHYIYQILTNGYKFNSSSWHNIKFVEKVGGSDLGWSLGYMINATNAIPAEKPSSPYIALPTFIVLLVICILLLIASALFLVRIFVRGSSYNYTSFPEF